MHVAAESPARITAQNLKYRRAGTALQCKTAFFQQRRLCQRQGETAGAMHNSDYDRPRAQERGCCCDAPVTMVVGGARVVPAQTCEAKCQRQSEAASATQQDVEREAGESWKNIEPRGCVSWEPVRTQCRIQVSTRIVVAYKGVEKCFSGCCSLSRSLPWLGLGSQLLHDLLDERQSASSQRCLLRPIDRAFCRSSIRIVFSLVLAPVGQLRVGIRHGCSSSWKKKRTKEK